MAADREEGLSRCGQLQVRLQVPEFLLPPAALGIRVLCFLVALLCPANSSINCSSKIKAQLTSTHPDKDTKLILPELPFLPSLENQGPSVLTLQDLVSQGLYMDISVYPRTGTVSQAWGGVILGSDTVLGVA